MHICQDYYVEWITHMDGIGVSPSHDRISVGATERKLSY